MQTFYLGIDGGGTKTDVLCADAKGEVIGKGQSGPTNLTSTNVGAASFNLKESVRQALQPIEGDYNIAVAAMGLAGVDVEEEYNQAFTAFGQILAQFNVQHFQLLHDSQIALSNASAQPNAVVLISGTGSVCIGRNDKGQTAKSGGMDYLVSDQGSGYDIGRHVLREVIKSYDGRRSKTMLEELVKQHFQIDSLEKLKIKLYQPPISKVEVAELSQLCDQAYQQGDPAAKQIFQWMQTELVLMVNAVVTRLGLTHRSFDLVITGSILKLEHMQLPIVSRLSSMFPQLKLIVPAKPAVHGALKLAMQGIQTDQPDH